MPEAVPDLSIVVPLLNESESLPELHAAIVGSCDSAGFSYEILFIDDGSTDDSWSIIEGLAEMNPSVHGFKLRKNLGKSAAMSLGFEKCRGRYVVTMDADLQDDPNEIPGLVAQLEEGFDLVSGWKKKRHDPIGKTIPSKFFNFIMRIVSGVPLHDFNCGLKIYRKEVVKSVHVYGEHHRFIPLLAKWEGYTKIGEKVVQHHPRKYGTTKFGLERLIRGFLDLVTIMFLGKYARRPMHFFGTLGTISFLAGFGISAYLTILKFTGQSFGTQAIGKRPLFFLGILLIMIGVQTFLVGLLGEMIIKPQMEKSVDSDVEATVGVHG